MPNNFKLTGDYYVSKAGNDANAGTSPDAPKRTVQAGMNLMTTNGKTLIIGTGVYKETVASTVSSVNSVIKADGEVIIEALNTTNSTFTSTANTISFYNITFKNYLRSDTPTATAISVYGSNFYNCKFINCGIIFYTAVSVPSYFTDCQFINVYSNNYTNNTPQFLRCIFINSQFYATSNFASLIKDCYLGKNTVITYSGTTTNINYNNFDLGAGIASVAASTVTTNTILQDIYGLYYNPSIASGGSGTQSDPYGRSITVNKLFNFTNHRILYPTFNASSSAVDPKFNSIEDQDFTLQADSWHIGRASDGVNNIGGTKYATRRPANVSFSGSQATVDPSLVFQYNNYVISGSQVTGSITSAPMAVNTAAPKVIQKVTYNGLLAFNKDTGSASGSNQNVPDFDTFTSASLNAAANPDRLVYYMRHTTGSSIPVSDSGWDNGGLWTAGQYNVFEWNTKPSIDNLGVGNGSGSFNAAASPTFIQATYVQMQIKLRNDYLL